MRKDNLQRKDNLSASLNHNESHAGMRAGAESIVPSRTTPAPSHNLSEYALYGDKLLKALFFFFGW